MASIKVSSTGDALQASGWESGVPTATKPVEIIRFRAASGTIRKTKMVLIQDHCARPPARHLPSDRTAALRRRGTFSARGASVSASRALSDEQAHLLQPRRGRIVADHLLHQAARRRERLQEDVDGPGNLQARCGRRCTMATCDALWLSSTSSSESTNRRSKSSSQSTTCRGGAAIVACSSVIPLPTRHAPGGSRA